MVSHTYVLVTGRYSGRNRWLFLSEGWAVQLLFGLSSRGLLVNFQKSLKQLCLAYLALSLYSALVDSFFRELCD